MYVPIETRLDQQEQGSEIVGGDLRALARAITLVENRDPAAISILRAVFPYTGRALKIGITGPPGVGKSTLAGCIAPEYRKQGHRVAILAIDPSSPYTGGAMLGDRIRMQRLGCDPGTYIRSMATRGHLGGLASTSAEVLDLLDAAGFSRILIESVGAGQDEIDIANVANALVVVVTPGLGDSVQLMKSGLHEVADVYAINKCDYADSESIENDVRASLELRARSDGWRIPIALASATRGLGIASLIQLIEAYFHFLQQTGLAQKKLVRRWRERIMSDVRKAIQRRVLSDEWGKCLLEYARQVVDKRANPYGLLPQLVVKITQSTEQTTAV